MLGCSSRRSCPQEPTRKAGAWRSSTLGISKAAIHDARVDRAFSAADVRRIRGIGWLALAYLAASVVIEPGANEWAQNRVSTLAAICRELECRHGDLLRYAGDD